MNRGRYRLRIAALAVGAATFSAASAEATITVTPITSGSNGGDYTLNNGDLTAIWDPTTAGGDIISLKVDGANNTTSANLISELDEEFAGTPFGSGAMTFSIQQTANYVDVWTTTQSTGTSVNPITYSFHYVMFNDDPSISCYEVLSHAATGPATSVGQGQFLFRSNPTLFPNLYQHWRRPGYCPSENLRIDRRR